MKDMGRFGPWQLCGGLHNSVRLLHTAIIREVPTGCARRRSPRACATTIQLDTNRSCGRGMDPAPTGREGPRLDVQLLNERPPDKREIDAARPVGARKPLKHVEACELLDHGASQPTQPNHSDAKDTCQSNLSGSGCCRRPPAQSRGGVRWGEAHRMRKARLRHDMALRAASTHVWDVTMMIAFIKRA